MDIQTSGDTTHPLTAELSLIPVSSILYDADHCRRIIVFLRDTIHCRPCNFPDQPTGGMMMDWIFEVRWSPYAAGIGIGVLSWFTFLLSNKPIGCSTAFARTSGMFVRIFKGKKIGEMPYYKQFTPSIDWEWMLVLGVILGGFISARISGDFTIQAVPAMWAATFGTAPLPRILTALAGGIFLGFGARWAGGCTSGHGISGTLQLAVSSWIAAICFFVGGIASAFIIFKVIG